MTANVLAPGGFGKYNIPFHFPQAEATLLPIRGVLHSCEGAASVSKLPEVQATDRITMVTVEDKDLALAWGHDNGGCERFTEAGHGWLLFLRT
jgi:hypothetical protein